MTDPKRTFITKPNARSAKPQTSPAPEVRKIPMDAKLLPLEEASAALTEQFGRGYSSGNIRRLVRRGEWVMGWHYVLMGKAIKVYIPAVQDWQINGSA